MAQTPPPANNQQPVPHSSTTFAVLREFPRILFPKTTVRMKSNDEACRRRRGPKLRPSAEDLVDEEQPAEVVAFRRRRQKYDDEDPIVEDENDMDDGGASHRRGNQSESSSRRNRSSRRIRGRSKKKQRRRQGRPRDNDRRDSDEENGSDDGDAVDDDVPFVVLLFRVGTVVGLILITFVSLYRYLVPDPLEVLLRNATIGGADFDDDDDAMVRLVGETSSRRKKQSAVRPAISVDTAVHSELHRIDEPELLPSAPQATGPPPLPVWNLTEASQYDAYALLERLRPTNAADTPLSSSSSSASLFWQSASGLWRQFSDAYGGDNAARAILERGISTSTSGTDASSPLAPAERTACRIVNARQRRGVDDTTNPNGGGGIFRMVFGGYSVTAGRGNYFSQSFPFVMEKHLHTLFHLLNVTLHVRNAAIGGVPSFPYGWCMPNFFGPDADVISWDFSMNEAGGDPRGLEAYLRHAQQLPHQPKVLVKDTHMAVGRRRLIVQTLSDWDHAIVHTDPAAQPLLDLPEERRPDGFQDWRKFGSPLGGPGQSLHHPAVKEHEFIAWLHTMHLLPSLLLVQASLDGSHSLQCPHNLEAATSAAAPEPQPWLVQRPLLPPSPNVTTGGGNVTQPWSSLLYGEPDSRNNASSATKGMWHMKPIYCRTTFEPLYGGGDLHDVVVSGTTGEGLNVLLPKSNMFYNRGWVLDMSDGEKQAKHKLDFFGGLGFVDRKKAYYGLYTSGAFTVLLPYQPSSLDRRVPESGAAARLWYRSLVLCAVNEKRDDESASCQLGRDVDVSVGGIARTPTIVMDASATLYLGKRLCLYVAVPETAILTTRHQLYNATIVQSPQRLRSNQLYLPPPDATKNDKDGGAAVGLAVQVQVNNPHIMRPAVACSISHIVWEQELQHA